MCTTYGGPPYPLCKAYSGNTKTLTLSSVTAASLGASPSDQNFIGSPSCVLDAYLKQIIVSKDGNILDSNFQRVSQFFIAIICALVTCSTCKLAVSHDNASQFCLSCTGTNIPFNGTCLAACGSGFQKTGTTGQCYCPTGYFIDGSVCTGMFICPSTKK